MINSNVSPDDYSPVLDGQVKHIAFQGYQYLKTHLPPTAIPEQDVVSNMWYMAFQVREIMSLLILRRSKRLPQIFTIG